MYIIYCNTLQYSNFNLHVDIPSDRVALDVVGLGLLTLGFFFGFFFALLEKKKQRQHC